MAEALDAIASGTSSRGDRELFRPLVDGLVGHDPFFVLADYRAYVDTQREVETAWRNTERWTRASILSTARMGFFSSDRSIRDYARDIWRIAPVPVNGEEVPVRS